MDEWEISQDKEFNTKNKTSLMSLKTETSTIK